MKKTIAGIFLGLTLAAGLYSQSRLAPPNDPNAAAGRGESEIVINAANIEKDIVVWVNDVIAAHVIPKTTEKIIVRDGRNIIQAAETTLKRGQWDIGDKKQIAVDSGSNRVTLGLTTRYGRLINISIQQTIAITPQGGGGRTVQAVPEIRPAVAAESAARQALAVPVPAVPAPARPAPARPANNDNTIEGAVERAAEVLVGELPDGATLAIISIASRDTEMAEFVIEELAYLMVETRKFKVVDRKSLDALKTEQQFQSSGDVDDDSAVSIGKLLGASVVITGSISGSGSTRRLRAKALDVLTAEIVAMASERF
jgi:TolB-like protein